MTDKQLLRFVASFRKGILGRSNSDGMCFAVTAPLAPLLRAHGVEAEIVEGEVDFMPPGNMNHFWIKLADGRVIDPTADQFNNRTCRQLPPVYIGAPVRGLHEPVQV